MWPARAPCSHLPSKQTGNSRSSTSSRLLQQRLLQHSIMHTTAASVGQQGTHTYTHTHAYTHMRTYAHTHAHAHTHRHTCAHTHTHIHMHTHKHTDTRTRTHTKAQTHRHTHMHLHAQVERVMGFANFSASLPTLPHLSFILAVSSTCSACLLIPSVLVVSSTCSACLFYTYSFKHLECLPLYSFRTCSGASLLALYIGRVGQNHTFIGIYGVHTVFLAGKSPYIRSYTVQIYGSGQPYT